MKRIAFILMGVSALALSDVVEVFKTQTVTNSGIKPPLRFLPPNPAQPPTPEEVAAFAAKRKAQAEYAAAVNAYLAQLGITNGTDTAAIESAAAKISKISVVKTNDTGAAGSGIKTIVTEGE